MHHFADRLLAACREKGPVCVGIDPVLERLPKPLLAGVDDRQNPASAGQAVAVIDRWVRGVLDAVVDHVPCVKIQSACFERYRWRGVKAYHELIDAAQRMGLLVIGDAKRGDIGISAAHYAAGELAEAEMSDLGGAAPDALTVNAYLGDDSLGPMIDVAARDGKGLFALVRTSNPGGDAIQSQPLRDGRTVAALVADVVALAGSRPALVGDHGYSVLGAVVGATKPQDAAALRQRMPQQLFLVPGFGAQGGSAEDIRACFKPDGAGALITASRSVIFAHEKAAGAWENAVATAAAKLRDEVNAALE